MKYFLFVFLALNIAISPQGLSKEKNGKNEMQVGEELTYTVSYSLIKLGEIKLKITEKKQENGKVYYKTIAHIDSYESVPFVSLHQIYESFFDQNLYSDYFRHTEKEKDYVKFTTYDFDYNKKMVKVKKGKFNKYQIWADSVARINKYYQDGLSLFYFARMNFTGPGTKTANIFLNEKFDSASIVFHKRREEIKIDAVDYGIDCKYLDGNANFVGIFGLTGYFEGWFSNDKYAVPILAKMKVIIGNITVELKEWRKAQWMPPKYKR
jgi:hypothetical protein